jgi:diacylglycerol kinase (ATP)
MAARAALAVHPGAGRGRAARIAGTVAARLRDCVGRLDLLVTNDPAEFRTAMSARAGELDVLVVMGGDGTVHEAVQFCAGTPTAVGFIPTGNGNDLARGLGLPLDPLAAADVVVAALRTGRRRRIDLGRAGDTWFTTVLCAGFDANVSARAHRMTWPRGPRRYDLAVLAELASWRAEPLRIRYGTERLDLDAILVAVGNTAWYGGGIPVCPGARPDDGLFDVTVVREAGRRELLRMLPSLRAGRHIGRPFVHTFRTGEIHLSGNDWVTGADGEPVGTVPVSARCVPGALTVLAVPPGE